MQPAEGVGVGGSSRVLTIGRERVVAEETSSEKSALGDLKPSGVMRPAPVYQLAGDEERQQLFDGLNGTKRRTVVSWQPKAWPAESTLF